MVVDVCVRACGLYMITHAIWGTLNNRCVANGYAHFEKPFCVAREHQSNSNAALINSLAKHMGEHLRE